MAKTQKMARLNFSIPVELHRKIKAAASLEGKTMRDFVLERVLREDEEFDCENVNDRLVESLSEVSRSKEKKIQLPTFKEFLEELD